MDALKPYSYTSTFPKHPSPNLFDKILFVFLGVALPTCLHVRRGGEGGGGGLHKLRKPLKENAAEAQRYAAEALAPLRKLMQEEEGQEDDDEEEEASPPTICSCALRPYPF